MQTIKYEKKDWIKGYQLALRFSFKKSKMAIKIVALLLITAFFTYAYSKSGDDFWLYMIVYLVLLVLFPIRRVIVYFQSLKVYKNLLDMSMDLSWNENGIKIESENTSGTASWAIFEKYLEKDGYILARLPNRTFYLVPTRFFDSVEEKEEFISYLKKGVAEKTVY